MTLYKTLLFASIVVLIIVFVNVIRNKMNIRYSMIWIIWGISMIIISAFPDIVTSISKLLGIQVASNTIFLVSIFLLYCLTFYVYLKISLHNEEILNLNYEISLLKKKIEALERKRK